MSVENAIAYIRRMRSDETFRQHVNEINEDEAATWAFVNGAGYDFTLAEFHRAQDVLYKEFGLDPHIGPSLDSMPS